MSATTARNLPVQLLAQLFPAADSRRDFSPTVPISRGPISFCWPAAATPSCHQLQFEIIKRYSNGLNFQIEYSWNRSLDDVPVVGGPQIHTTREPTGVTPTRSAATSSTYAGSYELPFGPGKKFLTSPNPLLKHLVGGWQVSGITYLRTGTRTPQLQRHADRLARRREPGQGRGLVPGQQDHGPVV